MPPDAGGSVVSDWATCTSPATYDLAAQPDGSYTFSVRAITLSGTGDPAPRAPMSSIAAPGRPDVHQPPRDTRHRDQPQLGVLGRGGGHLRVPPGPGRHRGIRMGGLHVAAVLRPRRAARRHLHHLGAQTDTAGNTGPAATDDYTLDRTAPAAPAFTSRPPSPGSDASPSWGFSGEAGATFECRLDRGATVIAGWAACTSPRTYDLAAEPDGTYTFSTRQTDAAGNTGPAATDDYTLDRAAPAGSGVHQPAPVAGQRRQPQLGVLR